MGRPSWGVLAVCAVAVCAADALGVQALDLPNRSGGGRVAGRPADSLLKDLLKAGQQLRGKVSEARFVVQELDRQALRARQAAPLGGAVLDGVRLFLSSKAPAGGQPSLLSELDAVDRELAAALQGAAQEPAGCGPAALAYIQRSVAARKRAALAAQRADSVRSRAERTLRHGEPQLRSVVSYLQRRRDGSARAVEQFRQAYQQGLARVSSLVGKGLQGAGGRGDSGFRALAQKYAKAEDVAACLALAPPASPAAPQSAGKAGAAVKDPKEPKDGGSQAKPASSAGPDYKSKVDSVLAKSEKTCKSWGSDPQVTRYYSNGSAKYADFSDGCRQDAVRAVLGSVEDAGVKTCGGDSACVRKARAAGSLAEDAFDKCVGKSGAAADQCLKASVASLQGSQSFSEAARKQCAQAKDADACSKSLRDGQVEAAFTDVLDRQIPDAAKRFQDKQQDPNLPDFTGTSCNHSIFDCHPVDYRYETVNGKLFAKGRGDNSAVQMSDISQGYMGDCYFLASLAAVAGKDPKLVQGMIRDNGNGTYAVTLHTDRDKDGKFERETFTVDNRFPIASSGKAAFARDNTERVSALGDAEWLAKLLVPGLGILLDATGLGARDEKEIWPMVAEKAFAQSSANGSYNQIGHGGLGGAALSDITGRPGESYWGKGASIDNLAELDRKGYAMVAGSNESPADGRIVGGHAYAVVSVDKSKGTVTLFNPWGYDNQAKDSKPTYVTLTEAEFQASFGGVDANPLR